MLGKATGSLHNVQRSNEILRNLNRIKIHDNATGKAILRSHLNQIFNNTEGIIQANGKVLRRSLLMGSRDRVQLNSMWENNRLITIILYGSR